MKTCCPHKPDLGLLLLRASVGALFVVHGGMKFSAMAGTIGFFASLGLPAAAAWLVAFVELVGGLAMLAGAYVCLAGAALAVDMLFAIILATGVSRYVGGFELELTLLLASLGVAMAGPGSYTICHALGLGGKKHEDACCEGGTCKM